MNDKSTSLKAKIRNISKEKNIHAQTLLQNIMFERFLERLASSKYNDNLIFKGGALIAAIIGVDLRSTMDIDVTLKNLPLNEDSLNKLVGEICSLDIQDNVLLKMGSIKPIRFDDPYGGYRVKITAFFEEIETPFMIDISTGDVITPNPVKFMYRCILDDDKQIDLWAYNIETILAEKIETTLRRSTLNTRIWDFYDIFIIYTTQSYDREVLNDALTATAIHRGSSEQISNVSDILTLIEESTVLRQMWDKYRNDFSYAVKITYEDIIRALRNICNLRDT